MTQVDLSTCDTNTLDLKAFQKAIISFKQISLMTQACAIIYSKREAVQATGVKLGLSTRAEPEIGSHA